MDFASPKVKDVNTLPSPSQPHTHVSTKQYTSDNFNNSSSSQTLITPVNSTNKLASQLPPEYDDVSMLVEPVTGTHYSIVIDSVETQLYHEDEWIPLPKKSKINMSDINFQKCSWHIPDHVWLGSTANQHICYIFKVVPESEDKRQNRETVEKQQKYEQLFVRVDTLEKLYNRIDELERIINNLYKRQYESYIPRNNLDSNTGKRMLTALVWQNDVYYEGYTRYNPELDTIKTVSIGDVNEQRVNSNDYKVLPVLCEQVQEIIWNVQHLQVNSNHDYYVNLINQFRNLRYFRITINSSEIVTIKDYKNIYKFVTECIFNVVGNFDQVAVTNITNFFNEFPKLNKVTLDWTNIRKNITECNTLISYFKLRGIEHPAY